MLFSILFTLSSVSFRLHAGVVNKTEKPFFMNPAEIRVEEEAIVGCRQTNIQHHPPFVKDFLSLLFTFSSFQSQVRK